MEEEGEEAGRDENKLKIVVVVVAVIEMEMQVAADDVVVVLE